MAVFVSRNESSDRLLAIMTFSGSVENLSVGGVQRGIALLWWGLAVS